MYEKQLKARYDMVVEKYGENHILGVFLYGSQNYLLATENSDIDVKAIYIPSMTEIALNKKPISKELHYMEKDIETHIEIKDIRLMYQMWQKQNINFTEILYTDYCVINPNYQYYWNSIVALRDLIVRYNPQKTVTSVSAQALNTLLSSSITGKKIANAYRLKYFIENYLKNKDYLDCLIMPQEQRDFCLSYKKSNKVFDENEKIVKNLQKDLQFFLDDITVSYISMEEEIDNKMSYIIKCLFERYEELNN